MPITDQEPFAFRFRWVSDEGQETGFLGKRGSFDGQTIVLDDTSIPVAAVAELAIRKNIVTILVVTDEAEPSSILVSTSSAKRLKLAVDVARSSIWAEAHKDQLQKQRRSHVYRDQACPCCGATIILSDMPRTPQLYCQFCQSLVTLNQAEAPAGEAALKLCDECGMFSSPRQFTIAYFYFLVVVYGWSDRKVWCCPACMRGHAWKMLFGNVLFVLLVPLAVAQLLRSYGGSMAGPFAGLDTANLKARKGDLRGALRIYQKITDRVPYCAGVKYNVGLALLQQDRTEQAAETFRLSLDDCSNYAPAAETLMYCYEQLGQSEQLDELKLIWGVEDEQEEESEGSETPS
ncbi:MAG: tetratricopeptide repeat protein [Candidatus Nealsonbacteria bacterium]|nr:tetratricopeptide repeat protein [Candidatus Nealsonbacteria bacterium]